MQLNKTSGARRRRSEQKMVRREEERAALHCKGGKYSELQSNVSVVFPANWWMVRDSATELTL